MDGLLQDLVQAVRALRRARGLALTAVLVMALGIAATTAVVSLLDELALRPLALPRPTELHTPGTDDAGQVNATFSYPEFLDLQRAVLPGTGLEGYSELRVVMAGAGAATAAWGEQVSGGWFALLGVRPALGRLLTPGDDRAGSERVVVLSDDEWRTRFGRDPQVLGRTILLSRQRYTIVGVTPRGFHGLLRGFRPRFWIPLATAEKTSGDIGRSTNRRSRWLALVARIGEGVSPASFAARLAAEERALVADGRDTQERPGQMRLEPLAAGDRSLLGGATLLARVLGAMVLVLLLLMAANLAGLLLARNSARRREMGVRLALGASRPRLLRQLLVESLVLAGVGGVTGVLLAGPLVHLLVHFLPFSSMPVEIEPRLDLRVLAASVAAVLGTGLAFGLAPALESTRTDVLAALRDDAGVGWWPGRRWSLRGALVVTQIALSFVLLMGAGLFARSLERQLALDPGYPLAGRHTLALDLSGLERKPEVFEAYMRALLERVQALPGVEQVSFCDHLQPSPGGSRMFFEPSELGLQGSSPIEFDLSAVGPAFFSTLGVPLVAGREFSESEAMLGSEAPTQVVVNRALARRLFGARDPLGRSIRLSGPDAPAAVVVGVVPDLPLRSLRDRGVPCAYIPGPLSQTPTPELVLRARPGLSPLLAVERMARALSADVATSRPRSLEQHFGDALATARLTVWLLAAFALVALTLAALGLYGLLAHAVARRTREIGVRMALGAEPAAIVRLVAGGSGRLVLAGLALGIGASALLARATGSMLYGVPPFDPLSWGGALAVLAVVALLASTVPARRAAHVRPAEALRRD